MHYYTKGIIALYSSMLAWWVQVLAHRSSERYSLTENRIQHVSKLYKQTEVLYKQPCRGKTHETRQNVVHVTPCDPPAKAQSVKILVQYETNRLWCRLWSGASVQAHAAQRIWPAPPTSLLGSFWHCWSDLLAVGLLKAMQLLCTVRMWQGRLL